MHRNLLFAIVGAVVLAAFLIIAQIWLSLMDWATFVKVIATLAIFVLIAAFLLVVGIDLGSNKKLKDENYLD